MLNQQQQAIIDFVLNTKKSALISARAGSGKTRTLVECAKSCAKHSNKLILAFNKSISDEMKSKTRGIENCFTCTFHSLGARSLSEIITGYTLNENLLTDISNKALAGLSEEDSNTVLKDFKIPYTSRVVESFVEMVSELKRDCYVPKVSYIDRPYMDGTTITVEKVVEVLNENGVMASDATIHTFLHIFNKSVSSYFNDKIIDFDAMVYLPVIYKLGLPYSYSITFVDEVQDLAKVQLIMLQNLKPTRLIAFGDEFQTIYFFRGATLGTLPQLRETFDCEVLKLSKSYRIPRAVRDEARKFCEDIDTFNMNAGTVLKKTNKEAQALSDDEVTDWVFLSYTNKALLRRAIPLLVAKIPIYFEGGYILRRLYYSVKHLMKEKNVGTPGLKGLISDEISEAENKIHKAERKKNKDGTPANNKGEIAFLEKRLEFLTDIEMLLLQVPPKMFRDPKLFEEEMLSRLHNRDGATFTTIHKAKGLEWDKVQFLNYSKPARHFTQIEVTNMRYVGITRAKEELWLVD